MSYSAVEEKLHSIPEKYMTEIMEFLSFIEYKELHENNQSNKKQISQNIHPMLQLARVLSHEEAEAIRGEKLKFKEI